jgi:hypothetical protein
MGSASSKSTQPTDDAVLKQRLKDVTLTRGRLTLESFAALKPFMRADYGPGDAYTYRVMCPGKTSCATFPKDVDKPLVFDSSKKLSPHLPSFIVCQQRGKLYVLQFDGRAKKDVRYTLALRR